MSKILLISVNQAQLKMFEGWLIAAGYEVAGYNSAEEIEMKVAYEDPDLVLMDIKMPDISGYEACRRIRRDEDFKQIPVILLVEHGDTEGSAAWGIREGATACVLKPEAAATLLEPINDALELVSH